MSIAYIATTTLAVSLLILFVLAVRGSVARRFGANMAYALWLLPALRLVMPPLPASISPLGWLSAGQGGPVPAALAAAPERTPALTTPPSSPTLELGAWASNPPPPEAGVAMTAMSPAPDFMAAEAPSLWATLPWPLIALAGVVATAVLYYGVVLYRQARFAWLVRMEAEAAPEGLARMAETIRADLGIRRPVAVKVSFLPSSPMVMGALRPTIVVPAWFELDYTPTEQRLAVVHEMAHVKRGDLWALHVAHALLALQWFNPLAHLALRTFRADQEAACDAMVLRRGGASAHAYGATLLKAVKLMRPAPQLQMAGLTLDHGLKERFQRMGWEGRPVSWIGKSLALASGSLLILASASTVSAHDEELMGGHRQIEVIEHDGEGTRVVRIDGHDRLVLADDPFADMHRELAKLQDLHADMPPPGVADMPAPPVPPVPPVPPMVHDHALRLDLDLGDLEGKFAFDSLSELGELAALGALASLAEGDFEITTSPDGQSVTITGAGLHMDLSGFDEVAFEAGMEAFEQSMEAFEAEMDGYAARIEAEAERYAAKVEARVEAIVDGPAFNRATEDGEAVIEALSEACEEQLAESDRATVVEAVAPHSGKTFRAICQDERAGLDDADLEALLDAHPELSDAEREAFRSRR